MRDVRGHALEPDAPTGPARVNVAGRSEFGAIVGDHTVRDVKRARKTGILVDSRRLKSTATDGPGSLFRAEPRTADDFVIEDFHAVEREVRTIRLNATAARITRVAIAPVCEVILNDCAA